MSSPFHIPHSTFRFARTVVREALTPLLVLYPTLLLLDSIEPGFVRSVVNPHAFLLVLLVAGMLAGPGDAFPAMTARRGVAVAILTGVVGSAWVWWTIGGRFGIPIAILAGVAITAAVLAVGDPEPGDRDSSLGSE